MAQHNHVPRTCLALFEVCCQTAHTAAGTLSGTLRQAARQALGASWLTAPCPCCLLQGYMVGNGCTDCDFDGNAQVPFALGKSLISTSLYKRVEAACRGNYYDVKDGSR